jgi:regulation of enolase protein 1 (concanavalin A-like superfamily)
MRSLSFTGVPDKLEWKNSPAAWHIEGGNRLTISSAKMTDWFVDPFDGKVANSAPMLFEPDPD